MQHIFHVRLLLEPSAAELGAQRVSGEQLAELRRLAQHRPTQSPVDRLANNRAFHLPVAEASDDPRLVGFIDGLLDGVEHLYHMGIESQPARAWSRRIGSEAASPTLYVVNGERG